MRETVQCAAGTWAVTARTLSMIAALAHYDGAIAQLRFGQVRFDCASSHVKLFVGYSGTQPVIQAVV